MEKESKEKLALNKMRMSLMATLMSDEDELLEDKELKERYENGKIIWERKKYQIGND